MKWALILSGGGGNGIVHIGILEGLEELGIKPDIIVGCSMGAIIGGVYCSGMSIKKIKEFIKDFNIYHYLEGFSFKLGDNLIGQFLQAEETVNTMMVNRGADKGRKILKLIKKLTNNKTFSECEIPFYCNAVDLISGKEILLDNGHITNSIRASIAFPGLFEPLHQGKMLLTDGSVLNNMPVWIARKKGIKRTIGINATPLKNETIKHLNNGFSIFLRGLAIACSTQEKSKWDIPSLEIKAYKGSLNFSFSKTEALINYGRNKVLEHKNSIKKISKSVFLF